VTIRVNHAKSHIRHCQHRSWCRRRSGHDCRLCHNHRSPVASAVGAIVAFGLWGSTLGRSRLKPDLARSGKAGFEEGQCGYQALLVNHKEEAVRWLRDATTLEPKSPELWIDLAAYRGLGNNSAATAEYHEARKLKPDDPAYAVLIDQQSTRNPEPAGSVVGIKHGRAIFETKNRTGNNSPNDRSPSPSPA